MNYRSWMYQDSPEELHKIDYCNEIQVFINYAIFNPRILVKTVLDVYIKCVKIKSFSSQML
jgi:hypothetical protein